MSDLRIYIQNSKSEYVQTVSPLAYTKDFSCAACYRYDLAADVHDIVSDIEDELVSADLKTVVANDPDPTQDWCVLLYADGRPYYKIDITANGTAVAGAVNTGTVRDAKTDMVCAGVRALIYDYLLDIFGPGIMKSSLSAAISMAASALGGTSASFSPSDDIDKIIEKISQETKAEIVKPKETLTDYVADATLMEQLLQIVDFLDNRKLYADAGIDIPKGVLLKGPPGTGKTYAARCIAGTVSSYFMICTASSLQGMYIGSGAANIKAVFKGARLLAEKSGKGVIVFIDELDSVGARGGSSGAGDEVNRTINQLLAEMSGFSDGDNILVMGATNFADVIDSALLRSGRFSRQITIDYPDDAQREQMIAHYVGKLKLPVDWSAADAAALTKTFTPADIKEAVNVAAIKCVRAKSPRVTLDDLNEAINEVITKDIRKPDDARILGLVTVHECGHALEEVIAKGTVPTKMTNYAYGNAGGFTQPSEVLKGIVTDAALIDEVKMLLAGRAAEELYFAHTTTGASNDLEKAKRILRSYYETYNFESYDVDKLDQKVLDRLSELYQSTLKDLSDAKDTLDELVESLTSKRVLYSFDIAAITAKILMKRSKSI